MKKFKTIILLSAKRCGSTAMFRMFKQHPDVGVCHVNQDIAVWEPRFWDLAVKAINGDSKPFRDRFSKSHPFLEMPIELWSKSYVFYMWKQILAKLGPIVFDKSPHYLSDIRTLNLINEFRDQGEDVRIIALIRDPKDAIDSQYNKWGGSVKLRELDWLYKYHVLENFKKDNPFIFTLKYEDLVNSPAFYLKQICEYCDIKYVKKAHYHIEPKRVGRYSNTKHKEIKEWEMSREFMRHLIHYGYSYPKSRIQKEG